MNSHPPLITFLLLLFSLSGGLFTSRAIPASQEVGEGAVQGGPVPAAAIPDCGCIEEAVPLSVHSEGYRGVWPPCEGRKLIAHMSVRNTCGYDVQVKWLGVRGRRSGDTEYWDMIYEDIQISAGGTWEFEPNNEKALEPGAYSFRYTCSPDGDSWHEFGDPKDFTAAASCGPTSTPVTPSATPGTPSATPVTPSATPSTPTVTPTGLALTVSPTSVPADGTTAAIVTLWNAPSGHRVRFVGGRGGVDRFIPASGQTDANGQFTAVVTSRSPGSVVITVEDLLLRRSLPTSGRVTFMPVDGAQTPLPQGRSVSIVGVSSELPLGGLYPYLGSGVSGAGQFHNLIDVTVDWQGRAPGYIALVLNGQTHRYPAGATGAQAGIDMSTQAMLGQNSLQITAYSADGSASFPMTYSFMTYLVGDWLAPALEQLTCQDATLRSVRLPRACTDPGNGDDTDRSFGFEINQAESGAPQIEAILRVPPTALRSVVDLGLSGGTGLEKLQFYALVAIPLDGTNRYAVRGGFEVTTRTCDRRRVTPKLILWGTGPRGEGPIKGTKPWLNIDADAALGASGQIYPVFTLDELDVRARIKLELEWRKSVLVLLKLHPATSPVHDAIVAVPGVEKWLADHAAIIVSLGPSFEISGAFVPEGDAFALNRAEAGMGLDVQGRLEVHALAHEATAYAGLGGNARFRYTPPTRQIEVSYARLYGEIGATVVGPFGTHIGGNKTVEWVYDVDQARWHANAQLALPSSPLVWQWSSHVLGPDYGLFRAQPGTPQAFLPGQIGLESVYPSLPQVPASVLVSNVYTYTQPVLAVDTVTGRALLLWVHDEVTKPVGQSQEIYFAQWDGVAWSSPVSVTSDALADGAPQVAWSGRSAMAVWHRLRAALPITATWDATVARKLEISTAIYDTTVGQWSSASALTDNDALDVAPLLAGDGTGRLMASWCQNSAGLLGGDAKHPDRVMFSTWDGSRWSTPTVAVADIPGLVDLAISYGDGHATLAYTQFLTPTGEVTPALQLLTSTWDGVVWAPPQQRTDDGLGNTKPQIAYNTLNQPLLVWQAGDALCLRNLTTDAQAELALGGDLVIDEFALVKDAEDNLAAVFSGYRTGQRDLFVVFYDADHGLWGRPQQLTDDVRAESYPAPAFDSSGRLLMAYASTAMSSELRTTTLPGGEIITYTVPVEGQTDLMTLSRTFGRNLTLTDDGLSISEERPTMGATVALSATVQNSGDFALENVSVAFYDGDPDGGGTLIGTQTLAQPLAGGFTATVTCSYNVPWDDGQHILCAVADPGDGISETDENDNVAWLLAFGPDLIAVGASVDYWGGTLVGLTTVVRNEGTSASELTQLRYRHEAITGTLVITDTLRAISPGDVVTVTTPWDFSLGAGSYPLVVTVNENQTDFEETFIEDNLVSLVLDVAPDLAVSPYYFWTERAPQGGVTVTVAVMNWGSVPALQVPLRIVADDLTSGSIVYSGTVDLAPTSQELVSTWRECDILLEATLYAWVNPDRTVAEIRYDNNLASLSPVLSGTVPLAERDGLVALHNLAGGSSWTRRSRWLSCSSPCQWEGVTCSDGHVTALDLHDNALSGNLSRHIGKLTRLRSLDLSDNALEGYIPDVFGSLTDLEDLDLSANHLIGPIPPSLEPLSGLRSLDLSNNFLEGCIPPELGQLRSLQTLDLSHNDSLTCTIPSELGNLGQLTTLSLWRTALGGSIPASIGNLTQLERLALSWGRLEGVIPPFLGNLTQLKELELAAHRFEGDMPASLCGLANLEVLDVAYNKLTTSDPCVIALLGRLSPDWGDTQTVPPTDLATRSITQTVVDLSWTPISYTGDVGHYEIGRSLTPGGPYTMVGRTTNKTGDHHRVQSLEPCTTYYLAVRTFSAPPHYGAWENHLWSSWSDPLSVKTLPDPIGGLAATNDSTDSPTLLGCRTTLSATVASGCGISYTWTLGDGSTASGAVVEHVYPVSGTYTATVTASNALGSITATTRVRVESVEWKLFIPLVQKVTPFLLMHFDDPGGATIFHDSSAFSNHGACAEPSCPTAGVSGKLNTALHFDGVDDYVSFGNPGSLPLGCGQ